MRASATRITSMRKKSGRPSGASFWGTTATSTARPMFCCWQMSSRTFGRPAWGNMVWTRRTTTPAPAYLGMPSWRKQALSSSYWQTMTSTSLSRRACVEASQWCQSATPGQTTPELRAMTRRSPSHILYLDANNLYGWAVSQPLPTGGFQWVEDWQAGQNNRRPPGLLFGGLHPWGGLGSTPRSCTM